MVKYTDTLLGLLWRETRLDKPDPDLGSRQKELGRRSSRRSSRGSSRRSSSRRSSSSRSSSRRSSSRGSLPGSRLSRPGIPRHSALSVEATVGVLS